MNGDNSMKCECPRCKERKAKQFLSIIPESAQLKLRCLNLGCNWEGILPERRLRNEVVGRERRSEHYAEEVKYGRMDHK